MISPELAMVMEKFEELNSTLQSLKNQPLGALYRVLETIEVERIELSAALSNLYMKEIIERDSNG